MTQWPPLNTPMVPNEVLPKIEGVTPFNKVRSSEIRKSLNIESLLLRIERSQQDGLAM